ncbi:hypothetical protein [Bacillus suaedaesalsae]|uniref:Uncharacterized protein n=1 Tax=Bacillus suaedaesalsae TaxID=2810349 RepID=A0ABS2DDU5_9BACI|nr:hypothetical protein [Bacillus suaedaesalsae]MBM6616644.1 hypothetical protein [Bacillus suaedaesalsae]
MLLLPKEFNENEIYILSIGFLMVLIILLLPRKFSDEQTILILLFNFFLSATIDNILAGPSFDFYDIMDDPKFEVMDLFIYLSLYTPSGYLLLYLYKKCVTSIKGMIIFLFLSIGITVIMEWVSKKFNVYNYNEWNLYYSGISYFFLYIFNILFFYILVNNPKLKN